MDFLCDVCGFRAYAFSELNGEASVDESAGEVVGYGELCAFDVCDPIVGVHVVDSEEIEAIESEPEVFDGFSDAACDVSVFVLDDVLTHSDVPALASPTETGFLRWTAPPTTASPTT